jgi:hypothetical protein
LAFLGEHRIRHADVEHVKALRGRGGTFNQPASIDEDPQRWRSSHGAEIEGVRISGPPGQIEYLVAERAAPLNEAKIWGKIKGNGWII